MRIQGDSHGIQFQKGLSEARFAALHGSEERCRETLAGWRWPDGFICPKYGGRGHCVLAHRHLYQCNACRRQTSLTAGTIFDSTKVALTTWFGAMYLITQTKQEISSIELRHRLGITQTTAWKIKTKLAEVMRIAGESERLNGRIEARSVDVHAGFFEQHLTKNGTRTVVRQDVAKTCSLGGSVQ